MKKRILFFMGIILGVSIFIVKNTWETQSKQKEITTGIVLTFDDKSILEWHESRSLFNKYDAKATFFVNGVEDIEQNHFSLLKELEKDGHEIGSHGLNHLNSINYVENNSINDYIEKEIVPSIEKLTEEGFKVTSFAYPFGARLEEIDEALFDKFNIIRGTSYTNETISIKDQDLAYYSPENPNKIVFGVGIDEGYNNSIQDVIAGLERAKNNNEVIILYGHNIKDNADDDKYTTTKEMLESIFKYAVDNDMNFYTISELSNPI